VNIKRLAFDSKWYLASYSDIRREAEESPGFDVSAHFFKDGIREGRIGSLWFDPHYVRHVFAKRGLQVPLHEVIVQYEKTAKDAKFVPVSWFLGSSAPNADSYIEYLDYLSHVQSRRLSAQRSLQ
jgi:hypothetical protein